MLVNGVLVISQYNGVDVGDLDNVTLQRIFGKDNRVEWVNWRVA